MQAVRNQNDSLKEPVDLVVEKLQIVTPDMYRQMSPARVEETREVAIGMLEGVAKSFILDALEKLHGGPLAVQNRKFTPCAGCEQ